MRLAITVVMMFAAQAAQAQYKCTGADGKVAFQQTPCDDRQRQEAIRLRDGLQPTAPRLRAPDAGSATIFGRDPRDPQNRSRIGAMLQESDVPSTLRVREVVDFIARAYSNPLTVAKALEMADLIELANRPASNLSGGQKKRLAFALAVIMLPLIARATQEVLLLVPSTLREASLALGA